MAIALTPFEAICGFRPIHEIKLNLSLYPELRVMIGEEGESISCCVVFMSNNEFDALFYSYYLIPLITSYTLFILSIRITYSVR
jgi:mannose-6-phosphate isomerase class I